MSTSTLSGLYVGVDMANLTAADAWLGKSVDIVGLHTGKANWTDWASSINWSIATSKTVGATRAWTIPMFADSGNLKDAAAGKYDSYYVQAAKSLIAAYGTTSPILVRVGEEFNGSWFKWAAGSDPASYVKAYQQFVDAFRSVGGNFKFEWNVNNGSGTAASVAAAYPGDKYVDYIGMDFYWDSKQTWSITDPTKAFAYMRDNPTGLAWLENFAAAHGKQTAYSEWGVNSSNASAYVTLVKQWFDSHNVAYDMYWDSNSAFAGKLDSGQYGATGDTYKALFGAVTDVSATVDTVLSSVATTLTLTGTALASGTGNDSDNVLTGNGAANILKGMGGNDTLIGGKGNDTLTGGTGNDTFVFAPGSGADTITDFGANGDKDALDISAYLKAGSKPTISQVGADTKLAFTSGDTILLKDVDSEGLLATAAGYTIKAAFFVGAGTDQPSHALQMWNPQWDKLGVAGDKDWFKIDFTKGQTLHIGVEGAGSGMGTLADAKISIYDSAGTLITSDDNSGSGNDALATFTASATGSYYVVVESAKAGGTGTYAVTATTWNTVVDTGSHVLVGGTGNDLLIGSVFDDVMTGGGGKGYDRFDIGLHSGHDTITDFATGDSINFQAHKLAGETWSLTQSGNDALLSFSSGDTIKMLGVSVSTLTATYSGISHT